MNVSAEICPHCGADVRVEGKTTQYYVPLTKELREQRDRYQIAGKQMLDCENNVRRALKLYGANDQRYADAVRSRAAEWTAFARVFDPQPATTGDVNETS